MKEEVQREKRKRRRKPRPGKKERRAARNGLVNVTKQATENTYRHIHPAVVTGDALFPAPPNRTMHANWEGYEDGFRCGYVDGSQTAVPTTATDRNKPQKVIPARDGCSRSKSSLYSHMVMRAQTSLFSNPYWEEGYREGLRAGRTSARSRRVSGREMRLEGMAREARLAKQRGG